MSEATTAIIGAIAGVAITCVGTFAASSFGYFNKDRELDIQMVNVGLAILKGEATGDKDSLPARNFALRLLRKYADVEIPETEFEKWAERGTTPLDSELLGKALGVGIGLALSEAIKNKSDSKKQLEIDGIQPEKENPAIKKAAP